MTRVKKLTIRNRTRYNVYSDGSGYKKNNSWFVVFSTTILMSGFIIFQLLVSHSRNLVHDNGKEINGSRLHNRVGSFLKGGIKIGNKRHQQQTVQSEEKLVIQDDDGEPDAIMEDLHGAGESNNDIIRKKEMKLAEDIFKKPLFQLVENDETEVIKKEYIFDDHYILFNNYHKGKSGKIIEEMLMAHAYIFHKNQTYGGCCGASKIKKAAHEELLEAIGLKGVLKFQCPHDLPQDTSVRRSVLPRDHYTADDTRMWTPEYVDYLRSQLTYPKKRHNEYTIVVHMLRGDTTPCRAKNQGYYRYLPNNHYQRLIDKYMRPGARVIIHTSPKSFEDLNEFRNRGYEVNVDAELQDTWKDFVTADIMIMSRSDFSMVPAMVAKGKVIYTPFWHHALRRWKRVDMGTMEKTDEEIERLRHEMCQ